MRIQPFLAGVWVCVIKAGLLACGRWFLHLPKASLQWHFADSSHIQWRDRAGVRPASLLTHVLRHKHLYELLSYSVTSLYYTRKRPCVPYIFSGAATPTVFNALAKVVFTAVINARRALVNSVLDASNTLLAL